MYVQIAVGLPALHACQQDQTQAEMHACIAAHGLLPRLVGCTKQNCMYTTWDPVKTHGYMSACQLDDEARTTCLICMLLLTYYGAFRQLP